MKNKILLGSIIGFFMAAAVYAAGRIQNEDVKSLANIESAAATITGNLSSGTNCITSPSSLTGIASGQFIYDTTTPANIASATTVVAIPGTCSAGQIQMSQNANGSGTGDTITFGGQASQLINDSKIWLTATTPAQQLSTAITNNVLGGGGGGSGINYLLNSSFEGGLTSWTTATLSSAVDTTNFTDGLQSAQVTASSNSGGISQDVTPSTQLSGVNMQASCFVKTSLSTVQVCARVGGSDVNCQNVSSSNNWAQYTSTFVGPSSGSIGVDIKTSATSTGTYNVDQCYVGKAINTAQLSQAQDLGTESFAIGTNQWNTSIGTSYTAFTANASIPSPTFSSGSSLTAPATKIPAVIVPSAPPGTYIVTALGSFEVTSTSGWYTISDGTNVGTDNGMGNGASGSLFTPVVTSSFTYTTTQTNLQFQVEARNSSGTHTLTIGQGQSGETFSISVRYFPSQQQAGFRPDQTPANWAGYTNGISGGCATSSSTIGDVSACTGITLTQQYNRNFGTVSTAGSSLPGITFTAPRAGNYLVCASGNVSDSAVGTWTVRMTDGTNVLHNGISQSSTSGGNFSYSVCGTESVSSSSSVTVKLQLATNGGTASFTQGQASGASAIQWNVTEMDAPLPAPYLTGSILSSSSGTERVERVIFGGNSSGTSACTSNPCTIVNSTPGISSITGPGSNGAYAINFGTAFSAIPTCTCVPDDGFVDGVCVVRLSSSTTSSVAIRTYNTSGVGTNTVVHAICTGPR